MHSQQIDGAALLAEIREWFTRFIGVMREDDLDILTLWAAHTWFLDISRTTPRLLISSPVPGSGKTTILEHLGHLTRDPVQMSTISSPALFARMLAQKVRTILIDEADRALDPRKEGVGEILAVLNSGYKQGATRPTLVREGKEWVPKELPTYSPVAIAGNGPDLPEDTQQRCIPMHIAPSNDIEESDWEMIEDDAKSLGNKLKAWSEQEANVPKSTPSLPPSVKGRAKERWRPLKRVADLAGGDWPQLVDILALSDVTRVQEEQDDGLTQTRLHVVLVKHIAEVWPHGQSFVPTLDLLELLRRRHPDVWGEASHRNKSLTEQGMGRMLSRHYGLTSVRPNTQGKRGRTWRQFEPIWTRLGIPLPPAPETDSQQSDKAAGPAEPDKGHDDGIIQLSQFSRNIRSPGEDGRGTEPTPETKSQDIERVRKVQAETDPKTLTVHDLKEHTGWTLQYSAHILTEFQRCQKSA